MRALCRLDAIEDGSARGFCVGEGPCPRELFVVRAAGQVYGYVNSCPHIGTPLNFLPDRFLTRDRTQILCATHGARFEIATGRCVAGPCAGRSLARAPIKLDNDVIMLDDATHAVRTT